MLRSSKQVALPDASALTKMGRCTNAGRLLARRRPAAKGLREDRRASRGQCSGRGAEEVTSDLVIVTNRGPAEVEIGPKDELVVRHAAGGLAPSLSRALLGSGALWIASAMSQGERRA